MTKKMKIELREEYCAGCGLCEVYCRVAHSQSRDIIKTFKKERWTVEPRVSLVIEKPLSFPLQCQHCEDAPCVKACITGAMYKNELELTLCDEDKCVGCFTCIMECPFGAIKIKENNPSLPLKCDFCFEADEPFCVLHCPNGALTLKEKIIENVDESLNDSITQVKTEEVDTDE